MKQNDNKRSRKKPTHCEPIRDLSYDSLIHRIASGKRVSIETLSADKPESCEFSSFLRTYLIAQKKDRGHLSHLISYAIGNRKPQARPS